MPPSVTSAHNPENTIDRPIPMTFSFRAAPLTSERPHGRRKQSASVVTGWARSSLPLRPLAERSRRSSQSRPTWTDEPRRGHSLGGRPIGPVGPMSRRHLQRGSADETRGRTLRLEKSSTSQRLATTIGTPPARNGRVTPRAPSKRDRSPAAVRQPASTTRRVRSRWLETISSGRRTPPVRAPGSGARSRRPLPRDSP